ncbi:hypothetical protein HN592_02220 [Candidatus Woesearchaeota archaeon]|jgi:hypothetical protein|nr:hypothetical protein [Candidatus Woesearchaeota archaeon]MBT4368028.1 hypothetical protein [Candidatus Woesearchaeota archaeon]MBT4712516.1 hypothetical protein [Candidatus Woesearchaeota archaeon]MBT6639429.1 hypothetical protein [Candidatus Woesearchaeota archaeon]MBT7133601.1 hypothetical protein [Candidatus Woesearchaeota archaeon]
MKKELLITLNEEFTKLKQTLKFNVTLDELDEVFFIKDFVQHEGFVSVQLSRQICKRITDTYNSWIGYLHGIVMPIPNSLLSMTEHQLFSEEERTELLNIMNKLVQITSSNTLIGLKKDKLQEGAFIDNAINFWNSEFKPKMLPFLEKVNSNWKEKVA